MSSYRGSSGDNSVASANISTKYKKKGKAPMPPPVGSDSDHSADSNSFSIDSQETRKSSDTRKGRSKKDEWEILEGLKEGQRFEFVPRKFEGYLLKRRKWPLKGWHKRFFVLDQSILVYSKSAADLARGKKHGSTDIGLSVISTKAKRKRIDIDADSSIFHLKCKSIELYMQWVEQLKQHRLHKQHQILYSKGVTALSEDVSPADDSPTVPDNNILSGLNSLPSSLPGTLTRDTKFSSTLTHAHGGGTLSGSSALRSWLLDSSGIEHLGKEISTLHQQMTQFSILMRAFKDVAQGEPATPSTKKRGKFRLRKNRSNKSTGSASEFQQEKNSNILSVDVVDYGPSSSIEIDGNLSDLRPLSNSNPALSPQSNFIPTASRPHSYSDANQLAPLGPSSLPKIVTQPPLSTDVDQRELMSKKGKQIISQMNFIQRSLMLEREKARQAIESDPSNLMGSQNAASLIASLRNSLNQVVQQNIELRARLNRIHEESNLTDFAAPPPTAAEVPPRTLQTSMSYDSSSCFSASEYFDAQEASDAAVSDTSSEASSDISSFNSDASDAGTDAIPSVAEIEEENVCNTGRRTKLPVPKPPSEDFSPFKFLYKNIGKDLSKVCMPISINEPLNMLQRLCEELEYSELLDKASILENPSERMVQVAAFAVSTYASSIHRSAHKPFNPLLGETYECIREDKGFKFIAEQVTHHPPVSACHAQSNNFVFWQDVRIKTKFWGRSLEFQPSGTVSLYLPHHDDLYEWNKVTSCVHNLFGGGQRWVDQYGEMLIVNKKRNMTCKLTFLKANSWSSKHHEVFGSVVDADGKILHNLFGKWTEALYCGHAPSARVVWRPGSMPEDHQLYYGFTRFAIELNELNHDLTKFLPPTDTRFRPDQRSLEEGNLSSAENMKLQLEQQQRERRKKREEEEISYIPMWFRCQYTGDGEEKWVFGGEYWNKRKDPGFSNMSFEQIW